MDSNPSHGPSHIWTRSRTAIYLFEHKEWRAVNLILFMKSFDSPTLYQDSAVGGFQNVNISTPCNQQQATTSAFAINCIEIWCSMSMWVPQSLSNFCPCPGYVLYMSIVWSKYALVHVLSTICLKIQLMSSPNPAFAFLEMLKSNLCPTFVRWIAQTPQKY